MAKTRKRPHELLAESLRNAKETARDCVVRSANLERRDRERLVDSGFLTEIIRGWYLLTSPDSGGGSTAWFGGFWAFVRHYLDDRFGKGNYCLSAESSLSLHAGDTSIPSQIVVLTKKASNTTIDLPHGTSMLLLTDKNFPDDIDKFNGVSRMSLPLALCRLTASYFQKYPRNIEIVLKMSSLSVAEVSRVLLRLETIASAERIVGAYKYLGEENKSEQVQKDMSVAGYMIKEVNPFDSYRPKLGKSRLTSPYAGRIRLMWSMMREVVVDIMPSTPGFKQDKTNTIRIIKETYKQDAYHSLSIEGYQVTEELISKIESGEWDPESSEEDRRQKDAMAAKGYLNAFNEVIESVVKVLSGDDPGLILSNDLQSWYRQLFAPLVKANLLPAEKVAGYRNLPVYITNSRHVPPPSSAVLDCMEVLFELLEKEENSFVKAVLGHFVFVYIHPYMDGNGRMGRFIMNLMLISGGYNWTVIRTSNRDRYMESLEQASTKEDISKFAEFIKFELEHWNDV
ncbi:Fic family protein [Halobacteriovorax sp. DA5]|uniref:Fic family protein n=1 Tax=Halobacteriovorax sp. DA5 TaxID=2067553 RepID=UPI000CD1414C|nr:Fic family protein [Halobacteriovorax sp. DA5]POB12804.1 cell filamentation protein Fic [Halobacteriovorax sp. DA5]